MKPWKIRIDWSCHDAYPGDPVEVELHIMGERVRHLRNFPSIQRAIDWALRYMDDRGVAPAVVNIPNDRSTSVTIHAVTPPRTPSRPPG